jgi:hypothetical protein
VNKYVCVKSTNCALLTMLDLQQHRHADERLSAQFKRHELVAPGKSLKYLVALGPRYVPR